MIPYKTFWAFIISLLIVISSQSSFGIMIVDIGAYGSNNSFYGSNLTIINNIGIKNNTDANLTTLFVKQKLGVTSPSAYLFRVGNGTRGKAVNLSGVLYVNSSSRKVEIGTTGVALSAANGILTMDGLGTGNDESFYVDLNSAANIAFFGTTTGVRAWIWVTATLNELRLDVTGGSQGDTARLNFYGNGGRSLARIESIVQSGFKGNLDFYTNNLGTLGGETLKMRITAAGNVGIGATTPAHRLTVNGSLNVSQRIMIGGGKGKVNITSSGDVNATNFYGTGFFVRDNSVYINSIDDGHLDLTADTRIDLNGAAYISGAITAADKITNYNNVATEGYGVPAIVDYFGAAGLATDISITNFTHASTAGIYRLSYYLVCTTSEEMGELTFEIGYTNDNGATTYRPTGTPLPLNVDGSVQQGVMIIQNAGANITYKTVNSDPYDTALYSVYLVLERLN